MRNRRRCPLPLLFAAAVVMLACSDAATGSRSSLTSLEVRLAAGAVEQGARTSAIASGRDQLGALMATGPVRWSSSQPTVATIDSLGAVVALTAGTTQIRAIADGLMGEATLIVRAPAAVRLNEVESNGGTPDDWVELHNPTTSAVDLSGWRFTDDDDARTFRIASGSTIAPGGFFVLDAAQFGFGLGAADAARLYNPFGVLVDAYTWTTHAPITYGRCPDGVGAFASTTVSTKGAANICTPIGPAAAPWPGSATVTTVDVNGQFTSNLSGLTYEGAAGGHPAVLWASVNGPGSLFRLVFSGGAWIPDVANGWGNGKRLRYTNNTGDVDAEGVTFAGGSSAGGVYVAAERNNAASSVSRISVLRYDASQAGTTLQATHEWNLTPNLPVVGANVGAEAITWIPDSVLVNRQFLDQSRNSAYNPAQYPDHAGGLFFVGLEANGMIYAFALNHTNSTFTRIATISSGFAGVMALEYDPETRYLWATCDDGCGGLSGVLEIETAATSATRGTFRAPRVFARPAGMPNLNNEGFAITPQSECVGGLKPVFWADDNATGGHSLRRGLMPCGPIAAAGSR